jgi:hypothetical protein
MNIEYTERQALNALSKRVFGKTSTWYNRLVKKGIKNKDGSTNYFPTVEEIKAKMLEIEENTKKMLEEMKASQTPKNDALTLDVSNK